jgi:hypothetical protein
MNTDSERDGLPWDKVVIDRVAVTLTEETVYLYIDTFQDGTIYNVFSLPSHLKHEGLEIEEIVRECTKARKMSLH